MAIRATITFVKPHASVSYVSASAADFKIVPESEYIFHYETLTLSELNVVLLNKPLTDGITTGDFAIVSANKGLSHSISFADDLARSVIYARQFTDGFALDDTSQVDKDINAVKGNITQITDVLGFAFSRPLADSTNGFTEVFVSSFNKPETDGFSVSDDLARVVVWSRGFGHSVSIAESEAISYSKVLTDAFGMDSATLVNKNYTGTKGNVFTFSEQVAISRTHGKALGNMMLGTLTLN
jgi:hypothetical protein